MVDISFKKILFALSLALYLAYNIFLYSDIDGIMGMIFFSFALVSGTFLAEDIGKDRGEKTKNIFFIIMILIILAISIYGIITHNPRHMWLRIIIPAIIRGIFIWAIVYILKRSNRKQV
ncbi:hypothetical protein [Anaerococcus urinomassiliensis]|uniref:hypothetical protein n=1 Tax=Anaerococcus urinomassiliensis TaxID=1745712 RepID=UPI00093BDFD1|nr:hypothetical protein [Anaerococcus urinomassiliensis]